MRVWRLARRVFPALDGEGARRAGGRWNAPGRAVVYASSTLSLAILELLVHTDPDLIPGDLLAYEVAVPDKLIATVVKTTDLPSNWRDIPDHPACRAAGDGWLAQARSPVLAVPSAIVPEELNYVINPAHPAAAAIRVVASRGFAFDVRLLR